MTTALRAVDLFSGAGGVTTGYKSAGVHVVGAVDLDPASLLTYYANHPDVRLFSGDLAKLDPKKLRRHLGLRRYELDVLTACAPCQTFSTLGAKARKARDPRNALMERVVAFAAELRPRCVVMENVPQLTKHARFRRVVAALRALGYGVRYAIVNAADFGVPQSRRRLVLIALRGVADADVPELSAAHPVLRRRVRRRTVRQTLAPLGVRPRDPLHRQRVDYPDIVARRIAAIPADGGSRSSLGGKLRLKCHAALGSDKIACTNIYGRMRWDDVAPTLTTRCTTPACGRFLHPNKPRAITVREAACLQSFPKSYRFEGGSMALQAQVGNAVPPKLARAIALVVAQALK